MGPTIERLNDLASAWSESLLRASWQGGLAIAAAWVLVRCHPRLTPRVACWAWRLADLKLVVAVLWATPLVVPLLPPSPLPGRLAETSVPALELPPIPAVESEPFTESAVGPAEPPVLHRPGLASVALLCWLCGVVGASVLAAKGWIDAGRLRRSCRPIERPDLRGAAVELAGVLGLQGVPELRAGSGVSRPMLVGAFRPAILLPIAMLDDPRLDRGDPAGPGPRAGPRPPPGPRLERPLGAGPGAVLLPPARLAGAPRGPGGPRGRLRRPGIAGLGRAALGVRTDPPGDRRRGP